MKTPLPVRPARRMGAGAGAGFLERAQFARMTRLHGAGDRMAGYSGTPLANKLGIKPGAIVLTLHAPAEYQAWLSPLPRDAKIVTRTNGEADMVHLFVTSLADLDGALGKARGALKSDGALWISWYKKSAKIQTDVTEDRIRERILKTDLVDVKVCAVSDEWSGLKCVVRKALR